MWWWLWLPSHLYIQQGDRTTILIDLWFVIYNNCIGLVSITKIMYICEQPQDHRSFQPETWVISGLYKAVCLLIVVQGFAYQFVSIYCINVQHDNVFITYIIADLSNKCLQSKKRLLTLPYKKSHDKMVCFHWPILCCNSIMRHNKKLYYI